jgi:NAD(P)H-dependent FMN reductase
MANAKTAGGWNRAHDAVAAVDPNLEAAMPYGVLEPGLKAAIDLLEREAQNEKSAMYLADTRGSATTALAHEHHYQAYQTAIELLQEQMERLKRPVG